MPKIDLVRFPERSLAAQHPEIAAQWHWTKNGDLTAGQVSAAKNANAWWRCDEDHDWQAMINNRTKPNGTGCPFCSGKRLLAGFNDLDTKFPKVAAQWHWTKNGDLTAAQVSAAKNANAWWRCGEDHDWQAMISNRTNRNGGTGCPVCSGKRLLVGFNDLASKFAEVAAQWHWTKNGDLTASQVLAGTDAKAWWRCGENHDWQTKISQRTLGPRTGCPVCSGRQVLPGFNDLGTKFPEVAAEWHRTKNGDRTPSQVLAGTGTKAWWRCGEDHDWQANIKQRTGHHKSGCPTCNEGWSKPEIYLGTEIALFTRIERHRPTPILGRRWVDDIYLPEFDIVIEFDGDFWHKDAKTIERDTEKIEALAIVGCRVIRCRTGELPYIGSYDVRGSNKDFKLNADNVLLRLADMGVLHKGKVTEYVSKEGLQNRAEAEAEIERRQPDAA